MMRALAGVSAAAVALIALPTTVGVVAEADSDAAVALSSASAPTGIAGFLQEPAVLGLNMGAFLWLSIAFLAVVVAAMAVGRSRSRGLRAVSASMLTPAAPAARVTTSTTTAKSIAPKSIGQAMSGFVVADTSPLGR